MFIPRRLRLILFGGFPSCTDRAEPSNEFPPAHALIPQNLLHHQSQLKRDNQSRPFPILLESARTSITIENTTYSSSQLSSSLGGCTYTNITNPSSSRTSGEEFLRPFVMSLDPFPGTKLGAQLTTRYQPFMKACKLFPLDARAMSRLVTTRSKSSS